MGKYKNYNNPYLTVGFFQCNRRFYPDPDCGACCCPFFLYDFRILFDFEIFPGQRQTEKVCKQDCVYLRNCYTHLHTSQYIQRLF